MITLMIFSRLLMQYSPKWKRQKEEGNWEKWEHYEDMREDMGVSTNTTKIPRRGYGRKKINPRKKHAV
jgi:hypothetical protein